MPDEQRRLASSSHKTVSRNMFMLSYVEDGGFLELMMFIEVKNKLEFWQRTSTRGEKM